VGRSGSDIRVYLEPGFNKYEYGVKPGQTFLDKVAAVKPDIVPMMVVCRFIMGDDAPTDGSATHAEAVTKYCAAIRAAGGEPMFYEMGWGKDKREAEGRKRILDLGQKKQHHALCAMFISLGACVCREAGLEAPASAGRRAPRVTQAIF
jgi:hypothetical protein